MESSDPIKLCEPQGEAGRYLCLSYCWGKAHFISTTTQNLASRKEKIEDEDLPKMRTSRERFATLSE